MVLLYLKFPAARVGLCAVVPTGTCTASVALPMSSVTSGEAFRIPTLFADESTTNVFESQLKSPVPPVSAVRVPKLVMFVCAAVCNVPVRLPEKPVEVKRPVEGL